MVQVIEQADIWGKIGQSVGKGIGATTQEVAKKGMLSKSLEGMQEGLKSGKLTPFDLAKRLATTPFLDTATASQLMPMMRDEFLRSPGAVGDQTQPQGDQLPITGGQPSTGGDQSAIGLEQISPETQQAPAEPQQITSEFAQKYGFEPETLDAEGLELAKTKRPIVTEDAIANKISELMGRNPMLYDSAERTRPAAESALRADQEDFDQRIARRERIHGLETSALDKYKNKLEKLLQKGGGASFADIPGEYQNKFENKVIKRIGEGIIPEKAAAETAAEALSLAKSRMSLQSLKKRNIPLSWNKNIRAIRESYKRSNALELFRDDLKNYQGFSDPIASSIAYEPSTGFNKIISEIKRANYLGTAEISLLGILPEPTEMKKFIASFNKNFSPGQSISALQSGIREAGYKDGPFMNALQDSYENDELDLTEVQARELETIKNYWRTLPDIWYSVFGNKKANR